jgi:hypothetical protein
MYYTDWVSFPKTTKEGPEMFPTGKRVVWIVLMIILAACGPASPGPVSPSAPASTPVQPTATRRPTVTPVTPSPTVSATPLPYFPLDGYVLLFVRGGELVFQEGTHAPVEVAHIGDAYYPYVLSDDNQWVVLYSPYSYAYDNTATAFKTDGTGKRRLYPGDWPDKNLLWATQLGLVQFIPGTHKLIFSTHLSDSYVTSTTCVSSIYLDDLDTGGIVKLADLGYSGSLQHESFLVSPNGKMVAVMTTSSVDILGLDGRLIRHNILSYKASTPDLLFPILSWLPDSSGLLAGLPNAVLDSAALNFLPASTIWRYTLASDRAVQIPVDPPPPMGTYRFSPDGKWIVYGWQGDGSEVYLGDLADGSTRIFGEAVQASFTWGPDSRHFIASSAGYVLGSIDTPKLTSIMNYGGWVDGDHFLWLGLDRTRMAEIGPGGLVLYDLGIEMDPGTSLFIRPK